MIDVTEALLTGDERYPRAFAAAQAFWDDFYAQHAEDDDQTLQKALDFSQNRFERALEKAAGLVRPEAKMIMAVTAIGALYRDGFGDREGLARRMVNCLTRSTSLSVEIKSTAKRVAAMYSLDGRCVTRRATEHQPWA